MPVVFTVGATGQAKLCRRFLDNNQYQFPIVYDRNVSVFRPWPCVLVHDQLVNYAKTGLCDSFMVCIGSDCNARVNYARTLSELGLYPIDVIHSSSVLCSHTRGHGIQVMPGVVVSEDVSIGDWCILNTNCSVDHDTKIGNGVHIMGSAAVAGCVTIGDYAMIGTNATILPWLKLGRNCYIGAGAVVLHDVPDNAVMVGNPARLLRYKDELSKVA